jgi:hypothetical protein
MATYLRPGVYVEESLNAIAPVAGPNSQSVAAFIGYADRGPTTPTLVTSWSNYISLYGGWTVNSTLHTAVLLFFSNGGSQTYVQRVVNQTSATASRSFNDREVSPQPTLQLNAANPGAWGNQIAVTISNNNSLTSVDLTIYYGGTTADYIVEKFTDLTLGATDVRYLPGVINSQSKFITATDLGATSTGITDLPVVATTQYLVSGSDGASVPANSDIAAAVTSFDLVNNSLVLNAPGVTDTASANVILSYAQNRQDVFVVVDALSGSVSNQITRAQGYTSTSYGAVYYPQLTIKNPTSTVSTATVQANPGGAIVGIMMSTDASRGVFKAPAGLTTRVAGAVSVPAISNADLDTLNSSSPAVNAIRYVPGSGIVVMGSRTLKAGYVDKYVPVRRTLIYLEKSLKELTQFAVFEPNDEKLWRKMTATAQGFLNDFWRQGGLRGTTPAQAFFVKCDGELNPQSGIDNGIVNIQVGVSLQRPAEFVVIKISQYDGGSTVTSA